MSAIETTPFPASPGDADGDPETAGAPIAAPDRAPRAILDPGLDLTLRPMRYPAFYEHYRTAIRNTWTVEEVDLGTDITDLRSKLSPAELHLVRRLVAFFATGDSIVANNVVLSLYKHINAPEARLYLSRQLYEEALHVQFYLTLLDTYLPDPAERAAAFDAIENIPSIRAKAEFCFRWMEGASRIDELHTKEDRRTFALNLVCFAACIEGLFFFAAFAYVYFLRSKGVLQGLAAGTNWVFRDESMHMAFAFEVVRVIREEEPDLLDAEFEREVHEMLAEAIEAETVFAADMLGEGVPGLSLTDTRQYLQHVADQRLADLGFAPRYGAANPFEFMALQNVQELANFFERTVSAYQVGVTGTVSFDEDF
jgi:ribonucleoside-diphosphate reductase beta chain